MDCLKESLCSISYSTRAQPGVDVRVYHRSPIVMIRWCRIRPSATYNSLGAVHCRTGAPQTRSSLLCFIPQALELPTVCVREVCGTG